MGRCFARWDELAALARVGLPVQPVDPDALPAPMRAILPVWADDHAERVNRAREEAARDAKRKAKL